MLYHVYWIKCIIIYINELIDENDQISEKTILCKLEIKHNWIAEISILKRYTKELDIYTKNRSSVKARVINDKTIRMNETEINVSALDNKTVCQCFL